MSVDLAQSTSPPPASDIPSAGRSPVAWILLIGAVLIALGIDLGSKHLAFERVAGVPVRIDRQSVIDATSLDTLIPFHDPVVVIPSVLEFTLVLNPGAVFGIGAGQRWFFVAFTVGALAFAMLIFTRWTGARDRVAHLALSLLISGGLGNLYDRMRFACVRDFIHPLPGVKLPFGIHWPSGSPEVWPYVSNVADLFLLIGIGVLLVYSWRKPDPQPEAKPDPKPEAPES